MGNKPSIDVQRRRKAGTPTGRAEAPSRPSSGGGLGGGGGQSGGGLGGGGSYRPSGGGFPIPSGGKLGGCGGAIVLIIVVVYFLITGGGGLLGGGQDPGSVQEPPAGNDTTLPTGPTNTPRPTRTASSSTGQSGQKWLVMLYQDADDQILEQDIYVDLNEAERVGSSDRVTIVTQIDRFQGAYTGDQNWTSTRRYLVTQDDDLSTVHSEMVDEVGEANMAKGSTLVDFATWAIQNYPADRYVLIMSDHGMGWPGGWTDPTPASTDPGKAPLISALSGDGLYLSEIDQALGEIRQQAGLDKFDVIGMDACLMSQLEVYSALQPHALYAVASEETEPALGWAYTGFLQTLVDNPDMSSEKLVAEVVNSYIQDDQRIVDPQARADFLRQGNPMGGFFGVQDVPANQLANQIERNSTLTAVDLNGLPDLMAAFNEFAYNLQDVDQAAVASARSYAQSYTSVFGQNAPPSYIDLGHFVQLSAQQVGGNISQSANSVVQALNNMIVAEKHGPGKPGSTGIAIYFPNSTMYRSPYTGPQSYNLLADRFVKASLWDDFLAFHYSDRNFSRDAAESVAPSQGAPSRAPGAGQISVTNVTASIDSIAPGETTTISAQIDGQNIGYIYLFIGYFDQNSNSIYVADTDYLESSDTRELNGVYYPVWPDGGSFDINFEWDASLFSISDGNQTILALFNPTTYGAAAENAVYTVNGTYTFADTGEQRFAQMLFMNGKLVQVLGYNGQADPANAQNDVNGAPSEITPSQGDTFTLLQKWMDLDASGNVTQVVSEPGDTLTFSVDPFTWTAEYAPAGQYLVGFLVTDLDGNTSQGYTTITVK